MNGLQVFLKRHMASKVLAQLAPQQQSVCVARLKQMKRALRDTQSHV